MKKSLILLSIGIIAGLTACSNANQKNQEDQSQSGLILVVSREEGSGTRGAFVELTGVEKKDESGQKIDLTTEEAEITNSTSVVMTTIESNAGAIGYLSLGSLNDTVKALKVNDVAISAENVKNGSYPLVRSFLITTKEQVSDQANDFITFIMSEQGQQIVAENGYISQTQEGFYSPAGMSGKLVIGGSSSVTPVMEKLKESYLAVNPKMTIEIQQSDSTTGVISVAAGVCDIGIVSRNLKDSEREQGLTEQVIAMDGIAVIVNRNNWWDHLTMEQIKNIFTGEIERWEDL